MKYEPPSDFDVRECQALLNRFEGDQPIDDPEDFLNDIPTYLEWIIAQHALIKRTEGQLAAGEVAHDTRENLAKFLAEWRLSNGHPELPFRAPTPVDYDGADSILYALSRPASRDVLARPVGEEK